MKKDRFVLVSTIDNSNVGVINLGKLNNESIKYPIEEKVVEMIKGEYNCPVKVRLTEFNDVEPILCNVTVIVEGEEGDVELQVNVEETYIY